MLNISTFHLNLSRRALAVAILLAPAAAFAQWSSSAYRVLGQPSPRQNGINMVQGFEFNGPSGVSMDNRSGHLRLYVSDTGNNRILAWADVVAYQNGDPPALILGQPGPNSSTAYGIGQKGFSTPLGSAVNPLTGDLYVADYGNSRILRFPSPFANPTRIEPDAVFGQKDFSQVVAGPSQSTLNKPRAAAFDPAGNLWVADSDNNRVVRFSAAALAAPPGLGANADVVIGQPDFNSGAANAGDQVSASGLDSPSALAFDGLGNLYVADTNNTRVLRFAGPFTPGLPYSATAVWGQADFKTRGVPAQPTASSMAGPGGVGLDGNGNLYVATPLDNRILVFSKDAPATAAKAVIGQPNFSTTNANSGSYPFASASSLSSPSDLASTVTGNLVVVDSGNHRVLLFEAASKTASKVWGQYDFSHNGTNQVKASSLNAPARVAIDYSRSPFALYVSDPANHRVLVWKDSVRFKNGDPADAVIGQPDMGTAIANVDTKTQTPTATSLSRPIGLVVNQSDGTLYIADTGNNRVLRYSRPVAQSGRIQPDAVLGQPDFITGSSAAITASTMHSPLAVALGPDGNLFVADAGANRVLEFAAGAGTGASAVRVYGQPSFQSATPPSQISAQTLTSPQGVFVDTAFNLYVADTGSNRVLIFPNTQGAATSGMPAAIVIGQSSFQTVSDSGGTNLKTPIDVAVTKSGQILIAELGNNRVTVFPSLIFLPTTGGSAIGVIGQPDLKSTAPNWNASGGSITGEALYAPAGVYLDRQNTVYIADSGNSRVAHFLKPTAVVNSATFQASVPVSPGSLAALFGTELADDKLTAGPPPWPTSMLKREVVVNDEIRSPLYYMSPTQTNFQIPSGAPVGTNRIAVRVADTGELMAGGPLSIGATSPGLFTASQDGKGQAAAVNADGRVNSASNPAAKGSYISLYGTGQGQVSPAVLDGAAALASPLSNTVTVLTSDANACVASQPAMCVAMGVGFGEIQFSGMAPGYVGLWQINVKIPADAPSGNVPVRVLMNGTPSNTVTVVVQ